MCQCHSLPASEPVSHSVGLVAGLLLFLLLRLFTVEPDAAATVAAVVSVLLNIIVGGCINLTLFDILGALIARPLSGFAAFHLIMLIVGPNGC